MSGGATGADAGTLTLMIGGDKDAFEASRPLLEAVANHQYYRPQSNQQVDPHNRRAIDSYRSVATTPTRVGQILKGFI